MVGGGHCPCPGPEAPLERCHEYRWFICAWSRATFFISRPQCVRTHSTDAVVAVGFSQSRHCDGARVGEEEAKRHDPCAQCYLPVAALGSVKVIEGTTSAPMTFRRLMMFPEDRHEALTNPLHPSSQAIGFTDPDAQAGRYPDLAGGSSSCELYLQRCGYGRFHRPSDGRGTEVSSVRNSHGPQLVRRGGPMSHP